MADQPTTIVEGKGYSKMSEGIRMKLKKIVKQDSGEIVLSYMI